MKKFYITLAAFAIIAALVYWLKGHSSPQLFGQAVFSADTTQKIVALTFDDSPSSPFTEEILDILKKHRIKATFFILGKNGEKLPQLVKKIYQEGHEIGNHSWSHKRLIFMPPSSVREEIERTDQLIRSLGYKGTIYFRAPYGNKFIVLPWVLAEMQRPHILFDIIPKDWEPISAEMIAKRVVNGLHPGGIILLHDGITEDAGRTSPANTVRALEMIIKQTQGKSYSFCTISQLIATK